VVGKREIDGDVLRIDESAEKAERDDLLFAGRVGEREHCAVLEALQQSSVVGPVRGESRPPFEALHRFRNGERMGGEVGEDVVETDIPDEVLVPQDGEEGGSALGESRRDDGDRLDEAGELRRGETELVRGSRTEVGEEGDGGRRGGGVEGLGGEAADNFLRCRLGEGEEPAGGSR
jgi:hypothetical protein